MLFVDYFFLKVLCVQDSFPSTRWQETISSCLVAWNLAWSCVLHGDLNNEHIQWHKRSGHSGGGSVYCNREVSEGSWHLKCGAGSGVTRLKWILDLNKVPPECIPFGGSQGAANGKKSSGVDPEVTGGLFHLGGGSRDEPESVAWERHDWNILLGLLQLPTQCRRVNERKGGWLEGRRNIDFEKGCIEIQSNVNAGFLLDTERTRNSHMNTVHGNRWTVCSLWLSTSQGQGCSKFTGSIQLKKDQRGEKPQGCIGER